MTASFPGARMSAARLEVLDSAASTNASLRERASDAVAWPHLSVLLTDDQTAGRGRLDRTWVTPAGSSWAISVLLRRLPLSVPRRGWIPLVAGTAMASAVSAQLPGAQVGVKWPNDVLVGERKICGILAEAAGDAVIVGAGVNTAMTASQLPTPTATSFGVEGAEADVDLLLRDYLRMLSQLVAALVDTDADTAAGAPPAVVQQVSERCVTLGRDVGVSLPDGTRFRGRATRLHPDGRLVLMVDGREHLIAAGDVVHARML